MVENIARRLDISVMLQIFGIGVRYGWGDLHVFNSLFRIQFQILMGLALQLGNSRQLTRRLHVRQSKKRIKGKMDIAPQKYET